jgi:hypothetical protein
VNLDGIQEELEILNAYHGEPIMATRFDFTFQDNYYLHNIELDEKGEVLRCKEAIQARVVSKTPIKFIAESKEKEVDLNDLGDILAEEPDKSITDSIPLKE